MGLTNSQILDFREKGFFISEPLFTEQMLEQIRSEFRRLWSEELEEVAGGVPLDQMLAKLRPFIGHVHERSNACAEFCQHPAFISVAQELVGPDADLYFNQAVMKPPRTGRSFGWHQDTQYTITDPLEYVTCWVAVTRATVENGTIWVVPGMHRQGLLPHIWTEEQREWHLEFDDSGKIPVEMDAGQMAVFNSLLPHSSGPNLSDEVRMAYVLQYHVGGVRERATGELVGDQVPLIRNGRPVKQLRSFSFEL